jgi:hypothetical protein
VSGDSDVARNPQRFHTADRWQQTCVVPQIIKNTNNGFNKPYMREIKLRLIPNGLLYNNTGYFSVFISVDNLNACFAVYPDITIIKNEHIDNLENHLSLFVIENVKSLFLNRSNFKIFSKTVLLVNKSDVINPNIILKDSFDITFEINPILYENLKIEIDKYQILRDKFTKVRTFLIDLTITQIDYHKNTIRNCIDILKDCINSNISINNNDQLIDLDYVKRKYLADKLNYKDIETAKNKLYNIGIPDIYYQEPSVPNKLENVF